MSQAAREPGAATTPSAHLLERALAALQRAVPRMMDRLLKQRCQPSDVVQSALLDAIRSFPTYGGDSGAFVPWTLRIAERNCLDRRRRLLAERRDVDRERMLDAEPVGAASQPSPPSIVVDREQLRRIARAARQLTREERLVLRLVAVRGVGHAEAARVLERSEGACRVLLARARAKLAVVMTRQARGG